MNLFSGQDRITEIRFAFPAVIRKQVNTQKPQTKYMKQVSNIKQPAEHNSDSGKAETNKEKPAMILENSVCRGTSDKAPRSPGVEGQGSWSLEMRKLYKERVPEVCRRFP